MAPYRLDVISLAPQAFAPLLELGVIGRALDLHQTSMESTLTHIPYLTIPYRTVPYHAMITYIHAYIKKYKNK